MHCLEEKSNILTQNRNDSNKSKENFQVILRSTLLSFCQLVTQIYRINCFLYTYLCCLDSNLKSLCNSNRLFILLDVELILSFNTMLWQQLYCLAFYQTSRWWDVDCCQHQVVAFQKRTWHALEDKLWRTHSLLLDLLQRLGPTLTSKNTNTSYWQEGCVDFSWEENLEVEWTKGFGIKGNVMSKHTENSSWFFFFFLLKSS